MRETQGSGLCARGQDPEGIVLVPDLVPAHLSSVEALGGNPVRIVGQSARVDSVGTQHAEAAAAAHQDRTDRERRFEPDAEMAFAGLPGIAKVHPVPFGRGGLRPEDVPGTIGELDGLFGAMDPLDEGGRVEVVGSERSRER